MVNSTKGKDDESYPHERRKPLSEAELQAIKEQLLESIYADIGKSVVKKILWICGALLLAAFAWVKGANHFNIGG